MPFYPGHGGGLRNVGSYQIAGHPFITGSTLATWEEKKVEFPFSDICSREEYLKPLFLNSPPSKMVRYQFSEEYLLKNRFYEWKSKFKMADFACL